MSKYTVLYDGTCGFCNFWVKWILHRDRNGVFYFASLQGEYGQKFLRERGLDPEEWDTIFLVDDGGKFWQKSDAILTILSILGGVYRIAEIGKVVPRFFRDRVYDRVAANRKKLMGTNCYLPTPEERKRFIA
jgi:predicted DCC family thiol-disulfide oxidoreductase YuxK